MANVNDIYPSKWMRAADLKGASHRITIQDVDTGLIGEGDAAKQQIILELRGDWKPLGLNKTNAQAIAELFGEDTDDWIGQEVVVFPTRVDFSGKMVDAIRVDGRATQKIIQDKLKKTAAKPAPQPNRKPTAPAMTQEEVDEMDDNEGSDIPF